MPIRIFVDGFIYENTFQKGIQRYHTEIFQRLSTLEFEVTIFLLKKNAQEIPSNCHIEIVPPPYRVPHSLRHLAFKLALGRQLNNFDIFHTTYYTQSPSNHLHMIVPAYDFILELFPEYFPTLGNYFLKHNKNISLVRADKIIGISDSTLKDLSTFYPDTTEKAIRIYPGVNHLTQHNSDLLSRSKLEKDKLDTLLYVGGRDGYKNFQIVLEAMQLKNWPAHLKLHVVGPEWTIAELKYLNRNGLATRIQLESQVTDQRLTQLYQNCLAFVFPSLCEGFGFPLWEAMLANSNVVCSNIPVFRETAPHGPLLFDPRDANSLLKVIIDLCDDLKSRSFDIQVRDNAKLCNMPTWELTADKWADTYRSYNS